VDKGRAVRVDRLHDGSGDFVASRVGEADVEYGVGVVGRHGDGLVDGGQHVGLHQVALSQDADGGAVAIEQGAVLGQLLQLDLGHGHEGVDLVLGALEVLDTEGVDGDDAHARPVAHLEDPCQRLEAQVVALDRFDVVAARKPPVAVHDESDVLRHGALSQRPNEQLTQPPHRPRDGRRRGEPLVDAGVVERAHGRPWWWCGASSARALR